MMPNSRQPHRATFWGMVAKGAEPTRGMVMDYRGRHIAGASNHHRLSITPMDKFFNTAGPNKPDIHHTLLPIQRVNWPELSSLIGARKYFMLHAPGNDVNAAMGGHFGGDGQLVLGRWALSDWTTALAKMPSVRMHCA
jgi:hypothetical protein